jgi:hypothetical protein
MNVGEYGVDFLLGTGFDLSAYSTLTITFTKPDKTQMVVTGASVTISSSPVSTSAGNFAGNTYAIYVFQNGDVDQAGLWSVRLAYTAAGPVHLTSDITTFTVNL